MQTEDTKRPFRAAETEADAPGNAEMPSLLETPACPIQARRARLSKHILFHVLLGLALLSVCGLYIVARRLQADAPSSELLPATVYFRRVKKGMTQADVESACGRPEYVQQMNNLGDEVEAWYYTASDGQIQINFDDGKVKLINRE